MGRHLFGTARERGERMLYLKNDYTEGTHPKILEAFLKTNTEPEEGYGYDTHCERAKQYIRETVKNPDVDVHFFSGGTQTNSVAIASMLRPYEAVICANTGHIYVNETGAIEHQGHKVISVPSADGKVTPEAVISVVFAHPHEHVVKPKVVYISNATEVGTVYTLEELKALYSCCQEHDLFLYCDGARIGNAIAVTESQMTFEAMCAFTDAFFIGGTKNGALLGEALVIRNELLKPNFRHMMKQNGALLAKGRVLGVQFEILFEDRGRLYMQIARRANERAQSVKCQLQSKGIPFLIESSTNQIFPIFTKEEAERMKAEVAYHVWKDLQDGTIALRFVTSGLGEDIVWPF